MNSCVSMHLRLTNAGKTSRQGLRSFWSDNMSKVTSKLQVTIPKIVARQLGIKPGDQINWEIVGEALRLIPAGSRRRQKSNVQDRLRLFDQATRRQQKRGSMITPALLGTAKSGRVDAGGSLQPWRAVRRGRKKSTILTVRNAAEAKNKLHS